MQEPDWFNGTLESVTVIIDDVLAIDNCLMWHILSVAQTR